MVSSTIIGASKYADVRLSVTFSYNKEPDAIKAVQNINFRVEPGQHVACVYFGEVCVKTKIAGIAWSARPVLANQHCLSCSSGSSRFKRVQSKVNSITYDVAPFLKFPAVDGIDVRNVSQRSLRQSLGIVPQEGVLFNETISANIRYGDISASDEAVERAAKAAQLHDRILKWPKKYETVVGERGVKLSGGEKQRGTNILIICNFFH